MEKLRGNGVIFILMPFLSPIFFPIWKGKNALRRKTLSILFPFLTLFTPNQTMKNRLFFFIFSFPLFHFLPFHPNQTPLHLLYVVKQSIRFIMCSCICLFLIVIIRSTLKSKSWPFAGP